MRAPDNISRIERACRLAGQSPNHRRRDKQIGQLLRQDDVTTADLRAVADYLRGRYDRRREQGRPFDPWHRLASDNTAEIVRQIRQEEHCSLRRAIDLAAPLLQLDEAAARRLWKRLTR
jgi:hypothetical protein